MPILSATAEDVSAITALVNSAYRGESSKQGWTTEGDLLDGARIDEETVNHYLAKPHSALLKYVTNEGELTGCVYLEKADHQKLYLGMLTVKPTLQAKGTGRELLEEAERFAKANHYKAIKISVIPVRHELIAWYKRRGFETTGQKLPFPTDTRFGIPRQPLELMVMEKLLIEN